VKEGLFPEKGILVLEEINRVPSDTTSVLYPLLLERKINNHSLAERWRIGVTMNPDTMNYSVNSLDDAMLDRFVSLEITADLDDYIEYSLKNNPNDDVLSFLHACPDMLLITKRTADSTALSKSPTPRGWTKVQEILNNCSLNEKLMKQLIAGILGPEAASSFFGFLRDRDFKIPSTEILLNNFSQVRPQLQEILDKNRLDIINLVIKKAVYTFQMNEEHLKNLNEFLEFLPEELVILFFKLMTTKSPEEFDEATQKLDAFNRAADKIFDILMG
jgi:hypothetical protein